METKLLEATRFVDMETECSYRYVNSKTEYFRPHTHDYYEIFIMLEGNAVHMINGEERLLKAPDAVFVRASDAHNYRHADEEPFNFLNLTFTAKTLDEIFSYLCDSEERSRLMTATLSPTVSLPKSALSSIRSQMGVIRAIAPEDTVRKKTALRVLLMYLFANVFSDFEAEEIIPYWLSDVCEKMQHKSNFPEGLSRMIELSGKSREHLTRSMRKYLRKSPSEFINEVRLNYIANMLLNSNHKILDIVFDSGFNTISHATTLFREKFGMSMSDYRRK
jgi:AraC family cel operon transcriptional repressor